MKQTPLLHDGYNLEIFDLIPKGLSRIVEVGCGNGALAKAYLESNEKCEYIGIEIDKVYAELAKKFCKKVICCNFEVLNDSDFFEIFPADCVVFGDSLEHLYDPWAVLMRVRKYLVRDGCVIACIPNMQHWSIQAGLNVGIFAYKDHGLMDRTHIRWFTRLTMVDLFESTGFKVVNMFSRSCMKETPITEKIFANIAIIAEALGLDPEVAQKDSIPVQWIIKAIPV